MCHKLFVKSSKQDKGLNAAPTCKKNTTKSCGKAGFLLEWEKGNPICSDGKQHREPDTTYMFVRDYSVVLIRLTMLQNIQTGGGFKAVIGGTYTELKFHSTTSSCISLVLDRDCGTRNQTWVWI